MNEIKNKIEQSIDLLKEAQKSYYGKFESQSSRLTNNQIEEMREKEKTIRLLLKEIAREDLCLYLQ